MFNQKKLLYLLFLSSISIYNTIQCSSYDRLIEKLDKHLQEYRQCSSQRMTYRQPDDKDLDKRRSLLNPNTYNSCPEKIFPNNKVVSIAEAGSRPGTCYNTAIKGALGLSEEQSKDIEANIIGCEDWIQRIKVLSVFNQIPIPKANGIACYGTSNKYSDITHCALMLNNNRFRSKLGSTKYTHEHDLSHLPAMYGNFVSFLELKKEFSDKNLLFKILMKKIYKSSLLRKELNEKREDFLNSNCSKISHELLRQTMGIDIDGRNEDDKTALMIAAISGRLDLTQLLLKYNANPNLQDSDGNTAMVLAAKNNQPRVVEFLLAYDADPTIKNNHGKSVLTMTIEKRRQF